MSDSLSIVIPSHHRPDLLRRCLQSVRQHAPGGAEVIVVDDGSRDGIVSRVAESFGVTALRLPRRLGFCIAANAGIRAAAGRFVELLNDDTEVEAGWAGAALACFADDRVAAVAPLVLSGDGRRVDSAGIRYYLGGVAAKRGHGQPIRQQYLSPCRVFGACASSAFYRRDLLLALGGFASCFGAYFEDVDLSFRIHQAGHQVYYEPRSRVRHHQGSSHGRCRRLLEQQSRNEERVFWRNIPAGTLGPALLRHLAVLAGKAVRRWQDGTLAPFVCGRLRLLGEIGEIRRRRAGLGGDRPDDWLVERSYWDPIGALAPPYPSPRGCAVAKVFSAHADGEKCGLGDAPSTAQLSRSRGPN